MQSEQNPWDTLAGMFQTGDAKKTDPFAADNMCIAWPAIRMDLEALPRHRNTHIIDFGCGSGGFCRTLCRDGYRATGIDSSIEMIEKARTIPTPFLNYIHGDERALERIAIKADAITSIMALQFIEDLDPFIRAAYKALKLEGSAVIAVFNPGFIERCVKDGKLFEKQPGRDQAYDMRMIGQAIPTYIRDEAWHQDAFEAKGFKLEKTVYPKFTDDFLRLFRWELPSDVPEYMIMTFRKNDQSNPLTRPE